MKLLELALQSGRLRLGADLHHAETLVQELRDFRVRITAAGNDQYGTWREGAHDDLLFAAGLAVWAAVRLSTRHRLVGGLALPVEEPVRPAPKPKGDHYRDNTIEDMFKRRGIDLFGDG